jgi:hypothetical protein
LVLITAIVASDATRDQQVAAAPDFFVFGMFVGSRRRI